MTALMPRLLPVQQELLSTMIPGPIVSEKTLQCHVTNHVCIETNYYIIITHRPTPVLIILLSLLSYKKLTHSAIPGIEKTQT